MADPTSSSASSSAILVPYRAVGLIAADSIPFSAAQLGEETFITTSIGRSFQVFSRTKLRLAFVGPQLARSVTALLSADERTIVAAGPSVHVYRRAELVLTCEGEHTAPVRRLLLLGDSLLTVCDAGVLTVWQLPSGEVTQRLHAGFAPSCLCHPATYLNKVVLGAPDGRLELWNLRSGARVHAFAGHLPPGEAKSGAAPAVGAVLCMEQSPALDVLGIGHASGRLVLHNLKADQQVLSLSHERGDAVTALAFRTDGQPILVTGSSRGALHVWNLAKRSRVTTLPAAHAGAVASAYFCRGFPELVTLGATDNCLRVWLFDREDGV